MGLKPLPIAMCVVCSGGHCQEHAVRPSGGISAILRADAPPSPRRNRRRALRLHAGGFTARASRRPRVRRRRQPARHGARPRPRGADHDTFTFQFTNDRAIESAVGYDLSRGATSAKFAAAMSRANAEAGFYASVPTLLWQGQDVEWESQAGTDSTNVVSVTALRAGLDLSPIERKLSGCKYRKSMVNGVAVYSATIKDVSDCSGPFGNAVHRHRARRRRNATSRHSINSLTAISGAMRGGGDLHRNAAITSALVPLAGDPALAISDGNDYCRSLSRLVAGPQPTPEALAAVRRDDPAGAPFPTFAFGTSFAPNRAQARMVLQYANARAATHDVAMRERAVRRDFSFVDMESYTQLLELTRASVKGRDVLLDVTAGKDGKLALDEMWVKSDLAFARC